MAGLWDDLIEPFTGSQRNKVNDQYTNINTTGKNVADQGVQLTGEAANLNRGNEAHGDKFLGQGQGYTDSFNQSMGANAADYMGKANAAANQQASQNAQQASVNAGQNAVQAGRAAGLNKGQAALAAGQQTGNTYTQNYQQGQQAGLNAYGQAANQFGQQANASNQLGAGMRQNAAGQMGSLGLGQTSTGLTAQQNATDSQNVNANQANSAGKGLWGGLMDTVGSYIQGPDLSDKRQKNNIKVTGVLSKLKGKSPLDDVLAKVKGVSFNYKATSGEDPTKDRLGVLAQDLEKTVLKDNVIDTPRGKAIDTGQQSLSNLNLIVELGKRVQELEAQINKGNK